MENPDDELLIRRIRRGEQQAFVMLVRRYERSLAALVGRRLAAAGVVDAVEDVLQETFVHAWTGLRSGSPRDVRAWLYQVARNRCADYLRSSQRRERFVEDDVLAVMVNRVGAVDARQRGLAADVVDAFDAVPEREREALKSFYVDGLSIAEIAARHRCAPGTVKRRLSHGRDWVRGELGIAVDRVDSVDGVDGRRTEMSVDNRPEPGPFPKVRPSVVVERLRSNARPVDMRELTWWFVVPELRDQVRWAEYQPIHGGSQWVLTETTAMRAARPAVLHGRKCVEVELAQESYEVAGVLTPPSASRHTKVWGRLTAAEVEWLGVERLAGDGTRMLDTFLDEGFDLDWGTRARRVDIGSWLAEDGDGRLSSHPDMPDVFADGAFAVHLGDRTFTCTRVVEMEKEATEMDVVVLAFVGENGRTVLFRRYDGDGRVPPEASGPRAELLPEADRLVIDGMTFVHSYDCLTAEACGVAGVAGVEIVESR